MAELSRKKFDNGIDIILVDANPATGLGVVGQIGSMAFGNISGRPKIYLKTGINDTDWKEYRRTIVEFYEDNNTDASTTSTSFQTFLNINFDVPEDSSYLIMYQALYSHNNTNNSPILDVLLDGVSVYNPDVVSHMEIKDPAASERVNVSGFDIKSITAGNHDLTLVYRSEGGGAQMTMRYGSLRIKEL